MDDEAMAWIEANYEKVYGSEKKVLQLKGAGGVLNLVETAWGSIFGDKCPFELMQLVEYAVAYLINSVSAERIGSHMVLIKSKLRQSLGNYSFAALCFLSFNSPGLLQVDLERVLDRWEEEGHTLGDKEANRSKATGGVLGRMATEGVKHTIFDDPALLELLSQTKDHEAEQEEDEHYGGLGYTLSEGGGWEDSDWAIQAGELAGNWAGSSEDEG